MAASADTNLAEEYNRYPVPPFDFSKASIENISLNTGALYYQETDVVLPGKNGMDLILGIRYDSGKAETVSIERLATLSGQTVAGDKPFLGKNMLDRFAFGWSFGFPTMEKSKYTKNIYFTLADGRTYQYSTTKHYLVGQNLFDVEIWELPNEFSWGGRVSQYTLEHSDGRREYYDTDGYLLGMQDRFQNTIGFTYLIESGVNTKVTITDTYGRDTVLERKCPGGDVNYEITATLPDQSRIIYYMNYWLYKKVNQNGDRTEYNYEYAEQFFSTTWRPPYANKSRMDDLPISGDDFDIVGWNNNANLTEIYYPNGAKTQYTYNTIGGAHMHNGKVHRDPYNYQAITWGQTGFQTYAAVKERKDIANGVAHNHKSYVYGDGYEEHYSGDLSLSSANYNTADNHRTNYTYKTKMIDQSAGNTYEYIFDYKHNKTEEKRTNNNTVYYTERPANYYKVFDDNPTSLPQQVTTTVGNMTTVDGYRYDNEGNLLQYNTTLPGNLAYSETMAYGAYGLMTSKQYNKDSGIPVVETYTLTSDQKSIKEARVTEGGTLKKLSEYSYNHDGTLLKQTDYTTASTSIPTEYQYRYTLGNNGAVTSYEIVKKKAGYEETSFFDGVGNLVGFTDGNGKRTNFEYDPGGRIKKELLS